MEIDKLARGHLRQELRPLKKVPRGEIELALAKILTSTTLPFFRAGKRLPALLPEKIISRIHEEAVEKWLPITSVPRHLEFRGFRTTGTYQTNAFYFEPRVFTLTDQDLSSDTNEVRFSDNSLELRFVRALADRKRVVIDNLPCNVNISEHLLYRMIERGAVESKPIALLGETLGDWLPLTMAFMLSSIALDRRVSVAIPVGNGLLLGSLVGQELHADEKHNIAFKRRMISDRHGVNFFSPRMTSVFHLADEIETVVRLTTFVNYDLLVSDQDWARDRLHEIIARHRDRFPSVMQLIVTPDALEKDAAEDIKMFVSDLINLIEHPRWQNGIKLV